MLKAQDFLILLKFLSHPSQAWKQRELAHSLGISLGETNACIGRLLQANLLRKGRAPSPPITAATEAAEAFIIHSIAYLFPGKLGAQTIGIPSGIAAPIFHKRIAGGNHSTIVWPDAHGTHTGQAISPIHPCVTTALKRNEDPRFYALLAALDLIRIGRPRERQIAIKVIKETLHSAK